jgi:hypothetical protein
MRAEDVETSQDTSALWQALRQAKDSGDARLVRSIEQRMRELSLEHRYAHLTDEELRRAIDAMTRNRKPEGMLGHSPGGGGWGGGFDSAHTSAHNAAIRANQHAGIEVTLAGLQAEWQRRHPTP